MSRKHKGARQSYFGGYRSQPATVTHTPIGFHAIAQDDTFRVLVDNVTACSLAAEPVITVRPALWYAMIELCARKDEWLAYLTGEIKGGDARVDGIYFPPQTAGPAHTHNIPTSDAMREKPSTIGAIHSHVGMQAFFSGTDKEHANWPVEIVLNNRGEYEANMRLTLPCGGTMRKKAKVILSQGKLAESLGVLLDTAFKDGAEHAAKLAAETATANPTKTPLLMGASSTERRWFTGIPETCPVCKAAYATCRHNREELMQWFAEEVHKLSEEPACPICNEDGLKCKHALTEQDTAIVAKVHKQLFPNDPAPSGMWDWEAPGLGAAQSPIVSVKDKRVLCPRCYEPMGMCSHTYHLGIDGQSKSL